MKNVILMAIATFSLSSFALEDKEFTCKNGYPELPANTYKISFVDVGGAATKVPFVEIQRHFKGVGGAQTTSQIRGFASHSTSENKDYLMIAKLTLEFVDGELINCRPTSQE